MRILQLLQVKYSTTNEYEESEKPTKSGNDWRWGEKGIIENDAKSEL